MKVATLPLSHSRPILEQVLIALGLGLATFASLCIAFIIGFQIWFAGRIYPGVNVAGVQVGGLSQAEAAERIQLAITFPETGTILLQDGKNGWQVKPQEIGLFLDPGASAAGAYKIGRQGDPLERLGSQFDTWYYGEELSPILLFDQRLAYFYLARLAEQINQPVIEANLGLQGTEVIVHSGKVGRTLDIDRSLAVLSQQVQSMQDGLVILVVKETPPFILDASAQAEIARQILSQPLTLTMPDDQSGEGSPWVFDQATLASMLIIERVQNGDSESFQVAISTDMLVTFLTNLGPQLQTYPVNARFIFNDDTRQLDLLQDAVIGRTLNVEESIRAIKTGLKNNEHTLALVFNYVEPPVTNSATAESLGITELVSQHTTYFYGSSRERVQNIRASASRFHALLVPPGETFSMVNALGDISLDNGYAEALIIMGGRTIKGIGGGICQVSTTLFRTAFFGGYPIVERQPHAYRVSYYEKVQGNRINTSLSGLDAAVFVPLVDFKFTNDSPYWLLMETYVNPNTSSITWKFYSTSDGRTVEWNTTGPTNIVEPPEPLYKENPELSQGEIKQVDWEAQGADVRVNRTVTRNGQVHIQDSVFTRYRPWQAIFEYGPGTEIPTPEPEE